jgi:hypothetical protein
MIIEHGTNTNLPTGGIITEINLKIKVQKPSQPHHNGSLGHFSIMPIYTDEEGGIHLRQDRG